MEILSFRLESVAQFDHLRCSAKKAVRNIVLTEVISQYMCDLEWNILVLRASILSCAYQPKPMHVFEIRDPKPRLIQAASIEDRIVHHALCAKLEPMFVQMYHPTSFACQKGKGNHRAVQQAKKYCGSYTYFAKLDIRHYFESFPHKPFLERITPRITDKRVREILCMLLVHGQSKDGMGLPIGNLTSQHFANFYLHFFDDWCTQADVAWIRYMDDILLFSSNRLALEEIVQNAMAFLNDKLQLPIKYAAFREGCTKNGVPFLGFRIFPNHVRLDAARKRRFFRKMNKIWKNREDKSVQQSMQSIIAWTEQGDCTSLRRSWHKRRGD